MVLLRPVIHWRKTSSWPLLAGRTLLSEVGELHLPEVEDRAGAEAEEEMEEEEETAREEGLRDPGGAE